MTSAPRKGWQHWKIADLIRNGVLDIGDGYRAKNSEMGLFGLPFARAGNLNEGFHFEDADILSEESVRLAGEKISKYGDITFTSKGTVGRFARVQKNTPTFVYSPQLCYWRVKREGIVDRDFLFYCLQGADCMSQFKQVKGLTDMADYVSLTNQRKMWLSTPPFAAQQRIASILSAYDDLIENNTRRIKILEEMAQRIYRQWFVEFKFPGHEKVKFLDSPLGKIPQGWEVKTFGDLYDIKYGKTLPTKNIKSNGRYPVYGAGDIIGFYDNFIADQKVTLITCRGNGSGTVWRTREKAFVTNNSLLIWPKPLYSFMKYFFIKLTCERSHVNSALSGSAQPQITIDGLSSVTSILPSKDKTMDYCNHCSAFFELIDEIYKQNSNLRRTRDLLLPKLISGEIEV